MESCLNKIYIDSECPFAIMELSNLLLEYLVLNLDNYDEIVILCIGTDRSTGDSLGPLVGYKLNSYVFKYNNVHLIGTLDEPVHAKNLVETLQKIECSHPNAFILAIDASLGDFNNIGQIIIKNGPLKPGLGVNKNLPAVGDISITGIVNVGGLMEYMVLQNTRLSLVMNMAETIAKGIDRTFLKLHNTELNKKLK